MAQPSVPQILGTLPELYCYCPIFKNEGPKSAEGKANWASVESGPLGRPVLQPEPYSERVSTFPGNAEQMRAFTDGCVPAAVLHSTQRVPLHLQNSSMRWLPLKPTVYIQAGKGKLRHRGAKLAAQGHTASRRVAKPKFEHKSLCFTSKSSYQNHLS